MLQKKLNIGFFGHSNCAGSQPGSYLHSISKHFDANIVNKGSGQASEERILFELKKCKNLHVAIILHSRPSSLFLPRCTRDIDITSDELKAYHGEYGNISSIFPTPEIFSDCINAYRSYLYHPDIHMNRFEGALALIDSYCAAKVPITIHILDETHKPSWFSSFKSGVRSVEATHIITSNRGKHSNGMSLYGNNKLASLLIELIYQQIEN